MSNNLHNSLERYFKDPDAPSTSNPPLFFKQLNAHLRKKLRLGRELDTAKIKTTTRVIPKYFRIKRDNCEQAFSSFAWSYLKHDEKARTTFFLLEKLSKEISPNTHTPLLAFIPSISQSKTSCNAMFTQFPNGEKNHIYLNPDYFENASGTEMINTLAHEMQHNSDYAEYKNQIIPDLISKYVAPTSTNQTLTLMSLPIRGEIFNYQSGKSETISPELSHQLLSAKYYYGGFNERNPHRNISQIYSHEETLAFIKYYAYRTSPLEQRAFRRGYMCTKSIVSDNTTLGIDTNIDVAACNKIKNNLDNTDKQINILGRITNMPPEDVCEMFCKLSFLERNRMRIPSADQEIKQINLTLQELAQSAYSNIQNIRAIEDDTIIMQ